MLHFILLPYLSHDHLIPMTDIANLLAQHGVTVTMITIPFNAALSKPIIDRAIESGLQIRLLHVQFPCTDVGLPEGCESMDALPSKDMFRNLPIGISKLQQPVEQILVELNPRPSCIISDKYFAWAERNAPLLSFRFQGLFLTVRVVLLSCAHTMLSYLRFVRVWVSWNLL